MQRTRAGHLITTGMAGRYHSRELRKKVREVAWNERIRKGREGESKAR